VQLTFASAATGSFVLTNGGDVQMGTFAILATGPDFNGDGRVDITFEKTDRHQLSWFLRGNSVVGTRTLNGGKTIGTVWTLSAQADFNADGQADLLWQHNDGRMIVWFMAGNAFASSSSVNGGVKAGNGWRVVGTGDFNADGSTDILFQHTGGKLKVWFLNGTALVGSSLLNNGVAASRGWHAIGAGDLDGNGFVDVVFLKDNGKLAAWNMEGTVVLSSVSLNAGKTAGSGWHARAVGDFDGNGKPDIAFQHDTGKIQIWFMNGSQLVSKKNVNKTVASSYRLAGPR
jgi:hypothetical protein